MILECIITTLDEDDAIHIAPMGPEVSDGFDHFVLRPYQTSQTYAHLKRLRQGVLHITDDVELMARAAIGQFEQVPPHRPAPGIRGFILEDTCRWYAFEVASIDDQQPRATLHCRVVGEGRLRDFLGFNRARHAVVEAAILTTRLAFLPLETVLAEFQRLAPLVEKTGGAVEQRALALLRQFVQMRGVVRVDAPARLHFGLFSFGNTGRQFGGVGVMVAEPKLRLALTPDEQFTPAGPLADELAACVRRCCEVWAVGQLPSCRIELQSLPPRHVGLGSGTQIACAVAVGLNTWYRRSPLTPIDLARVTGRGRRSAIGTYGFLQGGLIVEAGHLPDEILSPLEQRLEVPAAWRFVLVTCARQRGLSGLAEQQAFARLPAVRAATREALIDEVRGHMIPAILGADCRAFGQSVERYGHQAGLCFAAIQGGPYNGPVITQLVDEIRALGFTGVGQSSWGPTVFCVVEHEDKAQQLQEQLCSRRAREDLQILITPADNRGAWVRC